MLWSIDMIHYRLVVEQSSAKKKIELNCIVGTQKHQLRQQPIAHSCPVWPHELPLELKWQGRKYFLKQRLQVLFNSHKLVSGPRRRSRNFKTKTKTETLGFKTETKTKTLGLKTKTKTKTKT